VAEELVEACLALRRQHPTWGPAKVRAALDRRSPGSLAGRAWPAVSTIGAAFDREWLTVKRKVRRRTLPGGSLFAADAANDVWRSTSKAGSAPRTAPASTR
jgi:putative transposase